ncbi:unnamed protein product [Polarella glacialis]|uniref:dihydrolipoyllysine-residue succinyltransferase n=1 Tax=Polarella glacialis TaxID=89957 RepID=A0A813KT32_POLGL|nr:unnamed protein product [Polarella glacialis]
MLGLFASRRVPRAAAVVVAAAGRNAGHPRTFSRLVAPTVWRTGSFARTQPAGAMSVAAIRRFSSMDILTPPFGAESITEGTLMEWSKKVGDFCSKGEVIAVIETDKVSVEVKAPESGILTEILAAADETVGVDQKLAVLTPGGEAPAKAAEAPKAEAPKAEAPKAAPAAVAAKAAPAKAAPAAVAAKPAAAPVAKPAAAAPAADGERPERRVKMTRMRLSIAKRLKDAQNTAAMLTTFQEVDMGALMEMRSKYKEVFEQSHGVKLGFMSAFLKASCFALQQIPGVNAVIDDATNEIIYRDYVDISVAVASPRGLVVPVLRDVQNMSIFKVEATIGQLAMKAKKEELTLDDMAGGTFTISNGGTFGSMLGTPIINPPQSAILGMHATKQRPVVLKNGEIGARPIMYLALTYDHRLVDGREAVTFLCTVRDQIEDPRRLLLEC